MRKTSYLPAGVERENFKIDCRSLLGVGPADIMHVDYASLLQCMYARVADAGCPSVTLAGLIQSSRNRRRLSIVHYDVTL